MKSIFKRFMCMAVVCLLSIFVGSGAFAEKLLVTADLSMNKMGKNMYRFPDGFEAFLKLNACEHVVRVKLYNTSMHVGVGVGPSDVPQPVQLQYNVDLEYDDKDVELIPYLAKDRRARFWAIKKDVAEKKGLPPELLLNAELPRNWGVLKGVLVWGSPIYSGCTNVCDCSLSFETVRSADIVSTDLAVKSVPVSKTRGGKDQLHMKRRSHKSSKEHLSTK